ncbi:MAG: hypothetical protein J1E57_06850 [Prevotella sp.]|nr:hypothetical protein [Prevotella sp.]
MKKILLLTLLMVLCIANAPARGRYCGLDPTHPITFLGDKIKYGDKIILLNEHAIYVDGNIPDKLLKKHKHVYRTFQEAAQHFVDGTEEEPMCVYFAPYVYWANDPDTPAVVVGEGKADPIGMVVKCENLHLIGLVEDARNVVIASKRGHMQGASGNFTMFDFYGDGLQISNMTLGNFCNVDLEYPLKPELNIEKRSAAITQAHVAYSHGDKVVARNVRFISRLNMNPLSGAKRIFFDHCHMECTDDALAGNGVYLSCTIDLYGQKPFYTTHNCGAVFLDCDFTVYSGSTMMFTKMSGPLTIINCRYKAADNTSISWTTYPENTLRCYTSGFLFNNAPYKIGANNPQNTIDISNKPLIEAFVTKKEGKTFYNIGNLLGGDDGWNPIDSITAGKEMPTALLVDKSEIQLRTGDDEVVVKATPMRHSGYAWRGKHLPIHWSIPEGYEQYVNLSATEGDSITIKSINETDETVTFCVEAYTDDGLHAAVEVTTKPKLLPQPAFTQKPRIVMAEDGKSLRVEYALDLQGRKDMSEITWWRASSADGSDAIPIIVSRGGVPETTYPLTSPDNNSYVIVSVEPHHLRSLDEDRTMKAMIHIGNVVADKQVSIDTDFRTIPTSNQLRIMPGCWTLDGYKPLDTAEFEWPPLNLDKDMWKYDKGIYGAVGYGLLQAQRGARIMYQPAGVSAAFGDMSIILDVDPTKGAGQGFGSATGQYMDVCIKFDPKTLTGYALRIIRTPKHNKAVDFLLIKYENGVTQPITEPITAGCYRTGCTILLEIKGSLFTANVITAKPLTSDIPLSKSVSLQADIKPNAYGGFAIQHTGTVGEGTTMLHRLRVDWD